MIRPLTQATLCFAAGLLLGLRSVSLTPYVPVLVGGTILFGLVRTFRCLMPLALVALAGVIHGAMAASSVRSHCLAAIPDGAELRVHGYLTALPDPEGVVFISVSRIGLGTSEAACEGVVRAHGDAADWRGAEGGTEVMIQGRWMAFTREGVWPRRPQWAGILLVDTVSVEREGVSSLRTTVARIRGRAQRTVRDVFGRHPGLVEALILAQRGGIEREMSDRFAASGLAHLLSISGLHVGIIAGVLLLVGRMARLSARTSGLLTVLGTIAYVMFLGAPHAAARAALQLGMYTVARILQRPSDRFTPLATAALVLLSADPLAILDAGFQLSFAGTAGLIALRRPLMDALPFGRIRFLQDSLATSIAATAATAPITALHFGTIAPIGIVANLGAVPASGLAVPAVAVALAIGTVWSEGGQFLAGGAELLLDLIDGIAKIAASTPGGNLWVPRDAVFAWGAAAAASAAVSTRLARRAGASIDRNRAGMRPFVRRSVGAATAVAILVAWPAAAWHTSRGVLEIHAIDVGQGDAFAIRSPRGRWILVDAGPRSASFDAGRARVVPFLLRHGARRIEALILTHPDADHIGGAKAVLDAFEVGAIVDPGFAAGKSLYLGLLTDAEALDLPWTAARAGQSVHFDGVTLEFLSPERALLDADVTANQVSVAFRLVYRDFAALFLGDLPAEGERTLVRRQPDALRATLLKVAHHGSGTSTSDALLAAAEPRYALISVGRRNRYRHPDPTVIERLERHDIQVLRTDRDGSILVRVGPGGRVDFSTSR